MSYKPSDSYYKEVITSNPATGAATNADSTPTATANHNGTDDATFTLTVTNLDAGRYKITGTVPAGYASGDVVNVSVAATVSSVAGKAVIDTFVVDSKRLSDLNDITAASVWAVSTRTLSAFGFSVTASSVTDKTGYSLTQSFPTNFASASIDSSGRVLLQPTQAGVTIPTVTTVSGVTGLTASNLDATVSSRSTFAGGAVASVTGSVGSVVGLTASNLDATVSSRLASSAYTTPPTAAAIGAVVAAGSVASVVGSVGSVTGLTAANLDAAVSTRLAASAYTTPPTTGAIATAIAAGSVGSVTGSVGSVVGLTASNLDATISSRSTFAGGAVSSVTGNVGGSVGSVTGSVGSVTGLTAANLDAAVSTRSTYAGADTSGTTTLLSRVTSTVASHADALAIEAAVGTPMQAGATVTVSDKTGFSLSSSGLDSISVTAPTGPATTFTQMMVMVYRRFFKRSTKTASGLVIKTYADDGTTVITTQSYTDDNAGTETLGASS